LPTAGIAPESATRLQVSASVTAEFTPRVRVEHPKFTRQELNPKIDPNWTASQNNPSGKLLVRVTGLLIFDSQHFFHDPLPRDTNWEIHPVLKLEYCPKRKNLPRCQ
jgi:hypothetical protein